MARLTPTDWTLLGIVAEYHVLTVSQLAAVLHRNTNALRRRLRALREDGLLCIDTPCHTGTRGRPESVISLTSGGYNLLVREGRVAKVPSEQSRSHGRRSIEHTLLVNDFRMQFDQLGRVVAGLITSFYPTRSSADAAEHVDVRERFESSSAENGWVDFIPDGVCSVRCSESGRTVLFYLEADRGTEPEVSRRHPGRGFRAKIQNYQACFEKGRYRRWESTMSCKLSGFRLLVLAEEQRRLARLCRLVRQTPPSNFIWLADRDSLKQHGLWAPIWVAGGRQQDEPLSILGTRMPDPCPMPRDVL